MSRPATVANLDAMSRNYPLPYPRAALVTGAARRIGRAIALGLADDGWAVAVHYHASAEAAAELVAEIERNGGRAIALQADLGDEAAVAELIPLAQQNLGPLGLLVNNAARFDRDEALTATRESWDRHMGPNLRAPFVLMQQFVKQLPADAHGVVVNLLDQRVLNLTPHFVSYTLSKSALWTLTQSMALALAPRIRVVGIGPGPTLRSQRQSEDQFAAQVAATPLARAVGATELSATIRFILETPALTGQMIALDAGEHMGWAQAARGATPRE